MIIECCPDYLNENFILFPFGGSCFYDGCKAMNRDIPMHQQTDCCCCQSCTCEEFCFFCTPIGLACDIASCPFRFIYYNIEKKQQKKKLVSIQPLPEKVNNTVITENSI
jgi:hypothetical protein